MIAVEQVLLKVGQAVVKQLALAWMRDRNADSRRGKDLSRLIRSRFPFPRNERDILEVLWRTEDDVARQIAPACVKIQNKLPENEFMATLEAVADTLEDADLSNQILFKANLDPVKLLMEVKRQVPHAVIRAGLSSRASELYDLVLQKACVCLIHLAQELPEFNAATAVEVLRRSGAILESVNHAIARIPDTSLDAPDGADNDDLFKARYLEAVCRSADKMEVIGLTTHSYEPRTPLSVAYISLRANMQGSHSSMRLARSLREVAIDSERETRSQVASDRVEQALGACNKVLIRGEAGAGKSTLLRWLAINSASEKFRGELEHWNGLTPIIVKLREFAEKQLPRGDDLLRQRSSPLCGPIPAEWVHRQLSCGNVLLLVDGVDELVIRQRDAVKDWLRGLLTMYPDLKVVVTSRPTAVNSKWLMNEGFETAELEQMNSADVLEFISRWHKALLSSAAPADLLPCSVDQVPVHEKTLVAQLNARPHLRALARSPLLCAMLCALNLDRKGQLPRERKALYAAALDMLLERRDAHRQVASADDVQASRTEKQDLLRALAWWLNENSRSEMHRGQAIMQIEDRLLRMPNVHDSAESLLDHLLARSGVIRQPAVDRVDFVHRTFQEYLAAEEAVNRDSIDLLVRNAKSDLWRETILMGCAHARPEQRGRLINGILDLCGKSNIRIARQLRLLAAASLETAVTVDPPSTIERVRRGVDELLPPRSTRESKSLATVGESLLPNLPTSLENLSPAKAAACVRTVALINGPQAIDVLKSYAADARVPVQEELIAAWDYFDEVRYADEVLSDAPLISGSLDLHQVSRISVVKKLKRLKKLRVFPQVPVENLDFLSRDISLKVLEVSGVDLSLSPLEGHGDLEELRVYARRISDLQAVRKLRKLRTLRLYRDIDFSSLYFLPDGRLQQLMLAPLGRVKDYSRLGEMIELRTLHLIDCSKIADLSFLGNLGHLVALSVDGSKLSDVADRLVEAVSQRLRSLFLEDSLEIDLSPLVKLSSLRNLSISRSLVSSLLPLSSLPSLRHLAIDGCTAIDNLAPLSEVVNLRSLDITGCRDGLDLSPVKGRSMTVYLGVKQEVRGLDGPGMDVELRRRPN